MKSKWICTVVIFFMLGIPQIGKGGEMTEGLNRYQNISDVPASEWGVLNDKKIYFGHQSVGFNIMEGVNEILTENPQIQLQVIETADKSKLKEGVFAHSRVGQNRNPKTKIDDFVKLVENGIGNHADIAFFKFCMVDFDTSTNATELFDAYKSSMAHLEDRFPKTKWVYVTVPITTDPPGLKKWLFRLRMLLKKVRGEPVYDTVSRAKFNGYLRDEFKGKAPVFDLAEAEATLPDGTLLTTEKDGERSLLLVPEYTYDGGHLNQLGRKKIAEDLLLFLQAQASQ